jgi:rSAM/selenodomain-associated transferase 2
LKRRAAVIRSGRATVSVIIPTLDEGGTIGALVRLYAASGADEIVVSDGGSADQTVLEAEGAGAVITQGACGRAQQLRRGAKAASGDLFLFMHADTAPPLSWREHAELVLAKPGTVAGAFDFGVPPGTLRNSFITMVGRARTRLVPIPFGDQGLFLSRDTYFGIGGYPELPIMEDWEIVRRLKRRGRVRLAPARVQTSARRWDRHGLVRPSAMYAAVIAGYAAGVAPEHLARLRDRMDEKGAEPPMDREPRPTTVR